MATRTCAAVVVLALIPIASIRGQPRQADPRLERTASSFAAMLQRAVEENDRRAVAALVQFPATALAGGLRIPLTDAGLLVRLYDVLFPPEMRCALASHSPVVTADGMSLAGGYLWATRVEGRFRIVRITAPPASTARRNRRAPTLVRFQDRRNRSAEFSAWLAHDDVHEYIVSAGKGELLEVKLEGFPGRNAILKVFAADQAQPLDARSRVRSWSGRIRTAGRYRVEVVRVASYCDPAFTYRVTVGLR